MFSLSDLIYYNTDDKFEGVEVRVNVLSFSSPCTVSASDGKRAEEDDAAAELEAEPEDEAEAEADELAVSGANICGILHCAVAANGLLHPTSEAYYPPRAYIISSHNRSRRRSISSGGKTCGGETISPRRHYRVSLPYLIYCSVGKRP